MTRKAKTVQELIDILKTCKPDAPVHCLETHGGLGVEVYECPEYFTVEVS